MSSKSYIEFELIEQKPKTMVFSVNNKKSEINLGTIKWFSSWRQYCFFPIEETIFSQGCMKEIQDYIQKLMEGRKQQIYCRSCENYYSFYPEPDGTCWNCEVDADLKIPCEYKQEKVIK